MDEVAKQYFRELELQMRARRSVCKLLEHTIELKETKKEKEKIYYRYIAVYRCAKTWRPRSVWIDKNGNIYLFPT